MAQQLQGTGVRGSVASRPGIAGQSWIAALALGIPLLAATPPAVALAPAAADGTISGTVTETTPGVWTYAYTITNRSTPGSNLPITRVELPEIRMDVFLLDDTTLPTGWTATQQATSWVGSNVFSGAAATFKNGETPGAYLELVTSTNPIAVGGSLEFDLLSGYGTTIDANASLVFVNGPSFTAQRVDPPTPYPTPEPASLMVFGGAMAGLVPAIRRRRNKLRR